MATNTINQDITQLLHDIDDITEDMYEATARALHEGARIIEAEQRQLISSKSSVLASLIRTGNLKLNRKNSLSKLTGYFTADIKEHPESVIMEFGRPGSSPKAKKEVTYTNKKGRQVTRRVGKITAVPHIRLGFDKKKEEATQHVFKVIDSEVLSKWNK